MQVCTAIYKCMLYFVAVSSSPSTPKQSPSLKSDAPSSGPTLEPITPKLPPKGKSKCSNSTSPKIIAKEKRYHKMKPVTTIMHLEHFVEEKKSRKQSFSPVGLSDAEENSARKRNKSTEKGAKSDQPQSSRKRSKSTNEKGEPWLLAKRSDILYSPQNIFIILFIHVHSTLDQIFRVKNQKKVGV